VSASGRNSIQRELVIDDRQTGKSSIAIDTIRNQSEGDVILGYCAIGQQPRGGPSRWREACRRGRIVGGDAQAFDGRMVRVLELDYGRVPVV